MPAESTSMLVCGSLIASHNAASLSHLRSSLVHDPSFAGLRQQLTELPDVWSLLVDREPSLAAVDAAPLFHSLSSWLQGNSSSEALSLPEGAPKNILYAILTVLTHILEYATFLDRSNATTAGDDDAHSRRLEDFQDGGVQGLCIGLLSGIAIACSKNRVELGKNAAIAVRLAICAGACVDLAELQSAEPTVCLSARWSRHEESQTNNDCVVAATLKYYPGAYISVRSDVCSATITTNKGSVPTLIKALEEKGAVVKRINLSGRYHHSMYTPMFEKLLDICGSQPIFQFPETARPLVPLRRSDSGELVAQDETPLHEIALRCILVETADWHKTMVKTLETMAAKAASKSAGAESLTSYKYPVIISANSPASIRKYCESVLELVDTKQAALGESIVPAIACQLARSQNHAHAYRRVFAAGSVEELKAGLRGDGQGRSAAAIFQMPPGSVAKKPVVLVFAGQTGREVRLSEEAYLGCALLRRRLDACDRALQSLGLGDLIPRIFRAEPIDDLVYLHCMHFSVQYAVAMSWIDAGLQVSALVGHSLGQLTSLCISGILSLRDALKLVAGRARLIQTKWGPESGCMLSVDADSATVEALIQSTPGDDKVEIACYNSAVHHILAGTEAAIAAFAEIAHTKGVSFQRLEVTHGFHSHLVNSILPEYLELIEGLTLRKAKIPIEACSASQQCWSKVTPQMIANQSRQSVYWSQAIARVEERLGPNCVWLEAGSRAVGVTMARRALAARPATLPESNSSFHSARLYGADSLDHLSQTTLDLWREGVQVQSWMFHGAQAHSYASLELPSYCFENSHLWLPLIETSKGSDGISTAPRPVQFVSLSELSERGSEQVAKFEINQDNEEYSLFVQGRTVFGQTLAPSSVWMEAASRALDLLPDQSADRAPAVVHQLRLHAPFGLDYQRKLILVLRRRNTSSLAWEFTVESQLLKDGNSNSGDLHASGTVGRPARQADTRQYQSLLRHLRDRCQNLRQDPDASIVNGAFISKMMAQVADYDKSYMGIRSIACKDFEAVGEVDIPSIAAERCAATAFIPPLFDNLLIVGELHASSLEGLVRDNLYICKSIDSVITHDGLQGPLGSEKRGPWTVHSSLERESAKDLVSDMIVFRPDQKAPVLSILGARFTQISTRSLRRALESVNGAAAENSNEFSAPTTTRFGPPSGINSRSQAYSNPEIESDKGVRPRLNNPIRSHSASDLILDNCSDTSALSSTTSPSSAGIATPEDEENVRILTNLLSDHLNCSQGIPPDTPLVMLGLDSLVMMQLKSDIKKAFGSHMNVSKIDENCTLSDLCSMLFPNEPTTQLLSSTTITEKKAVLSQSASKYDENPMPLMRALGTTSHTRSAFIERAAQEFATLKQSTSAVTRETQFANFFAEVYPDQQRLVTTYILEAFSKLGCDLRNMQAGEILPPIAYLPKYEKLMSRFYAILEAAGIISAYNDQTLRFKTINNGGGDKASSVDLYRDILAKHPYYHPDHKLLAVTGPYLAECLSGQDDGLQLIFQEAESRKLLEDVYRSSPMFATGNALLGHFMTQLLEQQATFADAAADDVLRILEIGGGTGGTAYLMMDLLLAQPNVKFHYTFTDISAALVASTRKQFEARYGRSCLEEHMEFTVLDAERPPPVDRVGVYHMVVSSNCIHATRDLRQSCGLIERLLRPDGGVLCLLELTRPLPWLDCVFGLLDGWWRFDDGRSYALQDEGHWKKALLDSGFGRVDWSDDGTRESQQFRLITAWS
ncbi:polyketide synthase [Apiospora arundinis]|uniref:Polyketide synthase n=1 Tax=Apiospora arundinis TaxID=335852 RepID=A0ABR2JHQ7_9PEZI